MYGYFHLRLMEKNIWIIDHNYLLFYALVRYTEMHKMHLCSFRPSRTFVGFNYVPLRLWQSYVYFLPAFSLFYSLYTTWQRLVYTWCKTIVFMGTTAIVLRNVFSVLKLQWKRCGHVCVRWRTHEKILYLQRDWRVLSSLPRSPGGIVTTAMARPVNRRTRFPFNRQQL